MRIEINDNQMIIHLSNHKITRNITNKLKSEIMTNVADVLKMNINTEYLNMERMGWNNKLDVNVIDSKRGRNADTVIFSNGSSCVVNWEDKGKLNSKEKTIVAVGVALGYEWDKLL